MEEKLLFYGFMIASIPYVIIYIFVLIVLIKEGSKYAILNTDLSNYGSLRKLVKKKKKYKYLYLSYLVSTFLPIAIFILFAILIFTS